MYWIISRISAFLLCNFYISISYAAVPDISCGALPGCGDSKIESWDQIYGVLWNIIAALIQYVAIFAVIAVMIWWIMYLISSWDEEKIKKAKTVIIWSLVWVFVSVAAWSIINVVNNFRI